MISGATPVAGVIQLGTLLQLVSTLAAIIGGTVAVVTLARAVGHLGRGVDVVRDIHETVKGGPLSGQGRITSRPAHGRPDTSPEQA